MNSNFYKELQSITDFSRIMVDDRYKFNSALMTYLIFERHGKHIDFMDSSKERYTLVSKGLSC